MNLICIYVLLLQVVSGLSTKCFPSNGGRGTCSTEEDCPAFVGMPRPLSPCGATGLFCCPSSAELSVPMIDPKFPESCGSTPMYSIREIMGGYQVPPDEYSWLASLQYGNRTSYGSCAGSVINSLYLLTAAHCVKSKRIRSIGGLTSVRLGDFEHETKCDYGAPGCNFYQVYEVEQTIPHENYIEDDSVIVYDIALIRVKRRIQLGPNVKPICLPFSSIIAEEPVAGQFVISTGWGRDPTPGRPKIVAKRAVSIPLWEKSRCSFSGGRSERLICAGDPGKGSCHGDSGGPLMYTFEERRMVIEGIVSYGYECGSSSYPAVYTRVRSYQDWIEQHIDMRPSSVESLHSPSSTHRKPTQPTIYPKYPQPCGSTPMYPIRQIIGGSLIQPDEFSWLASLQYGNRISYGVCSASVINSLYLLTAAHCVKSKQIRLDGGVTGVLLGDFEHETKCDYGAPGCNFYQLYEVEKTISHESYIEDSTVIAYDIALIRVRRSIQLGPNVKAICLPFGNVPEPVAGQFLTTAGWGRAPTIGRPEIIAKRGVSIGLWEHSRCSMASSMIEGQICAGEGGKGNCEGDSGGPLMSMFETRRMVVEGIVSYGHNCGNQYMPVVYTRVRSYMDWINSTMDMRSTQQ